MGSCIDARHYLSALRHRIQMQRQPPEIADAVKGRVVRVVLVRGVHARAGDDREVVAVNYRPRLHERR